MNKVNQLTICKEDYSSYKEFKNAVKRAIMVLLENDYIMTVKYDDRDKEMGIVVINYDYANEEFGGALPYWLLPDEIEILENAKEALNEINKE